MIDAVSQLVAFVLDLVGLDKNAVKEGLQSVGLAPVWEAFRQALLHPYSISSALICLAFERVLWVYRRRQLVTASLMLDYLYPLLNAAFFMSTLEGLMAAAIVGAYDGYLPFLRFDVLSQLPPWIQVITVFFAIDFIFYCSHYLHHKVTLFWYLHAVHHSQEDLNPMTTYRAHPFESATKTLVRTVPFMILGGTPTTVFWFAWLNSFWGFFIHSNIRTNLGPLKYVVVTPQYHRVHHSIEPQHFDKNYGERLTLWDWMFGTIWPHFNDYPATGVRNFPVPMESDRSPLGLLKSWWALMLYPFRRVWGAVAGSPSNKVDVEPT